MPRVAHRLAQLALAAVLGLGLVLVLALGLACQSPPPRSQPTDASPPASSQPASPEPTKPASDCRPAPLRAELASYCEFDVGLPALDLAEVPWSAPTYHPIASTVVSIDRDGVRDPDRDDPAHVPLATWLASPPRSLAEPGELVVAIAGDVPLASVAELLHGLAEAGREHLIVLVHTRDPRPLPQPRDPERLAELRDALPTTKRERLMYVAAAVREIAMACPPIAEAFAQLKTSPVVGERCSRLAELAPAAIVKCGCADQAEIMTVLYALAIGFVPPRGRTAAIPVTLDRSRAAPAPKAATWASFVAQTMTSPGPRTLWLE